MVNDDRIHELEERVSNLEKAVFDNSSTRENTNSKRLSLPEFLRDCTVPHHREKTLAIGYFYENYKNMDSFTVTDIREGYKKARWKAPQNPSDIVGKASGEGLLLEFGKEEQSKLWALTKTGIDFVEKEILDDASDK